MFIFRELCVVFFLFYTAQSCSSHKSITTTVPTRLPRTSSGAPLITTSTSKPTSDIPKDDATVPQKKNTAAWGYNDYSKWPELCHAGLQQSPINIEILDVEIVNYEPLAFHDYNATGTVNGINNGHTGSPVLIKYKTYPELVHGFLSWSRQPSISGGGLGARYVLSQFHFHWDGRDNFGSEHTVGNLHYPLELHFVHIREDLDETNAGSVPGGIAVSVFFELSTDEKTLLFNLDALFEETVDPEHGHEEEDYSPAELLPANTSTFFRYNGSLTTPPCSEGVVWTILTERNYITEKQLKMLRLLLTEEEELLIDNWRPVQQINNRTIYFVKTVNNK